MNEIITVPAAEYRERMLALRGEGFDFLESFTGMDWGDALGVVCHLEATSTGRRIAVKTSTPDREHPELPSVCDIWKAAELNEREAFDFFGIRFVGHPDMRRLYLREDWVGHPLRKDYDASPETNPVRMSNEEAVDTTPTLQLNEEGELEERVNVIFEDNQYVINIGPQHPATHGVLRFRVALET